MASSVKDSQNELVKSVSCYNEKPLILHGYIGPFVSIYVLLVYTWFTKYLHSDAQETWFIAVAAMVLLQILSYLFCHWSVHVRCFLAFTRVSLS